MSTTTQFEDTFTLDFPKPPPRPKTRWVDGERACSTCGVSYKGLIRCPVCNRQLRSSPRHKKGKDRLRMMRLEREISDVRVVVYVDKEKKIKL